MPSLRTIFTLYGFISRASCLTPSCFRFVALRYVSRRPLLLVLCSPLLPPTMSPVLSFPPASTSPPPPLMSGLKSRRAFEIVVHHSLCPSLSSPFLTSCASNDSRRVLVYPRERSSSGGWGRRMAHAYGVSADSPFQACAD